MGARDEGRVPPFDRCRGAGVRGGRPPARPVLSELVEPEGLARAVRVYKRRVRYTVGGCIAELSAVQADGTQLRTVAIESEDAAAVIAAVREVGLGGWANTSYQEALGRMVDLAPERFAAIDVGTNSVKFHVGERAADGTWDHGRRPRRDHPAG